MEDLVELAESDPLRCVEVCESIVSSDPESPEAATALRAMGIAYRSLGEMEKSISVLLRSRDLFGQLDLIEESHESAISHAASLAMSGHLVPAFSSLEPLCDSDDEAVRSHALVQTAGLKAVSGALKEALSLYQLAEPILVNRKDLRWLALLYSTRGLVRTYSNEYESAENDLRSAMQLFESMGRYSSAAEMLGNLGFLYVVSGAVARGLATLMEADKAFKLWGIPPEALRTAQAFGYMVGGLPDRAFEVLTEAARQLKASGRELLQAESLIHGARAALAAGNMTGALEAVEAAEGLASLRDRKVWMALLRLIQADAAFQSGGDCDPGEMRSLAQYFRESGNVTSAAHGLALACLADLAEGNLVDALQAVSLMEDIELGLVELPTRVRMGLARAGAFMAMGNDELALDTLEGLVDLIDDHRLLLGASESRAGLSRLADDVAVLGLAITPDGLPAVEWLDPFRASSLRIVPVVPNRDPVIAQALGELRRRTREVEDARLAGEFDPAAAVEVAEMEAMIRDLAISRGPSVGRTASPDIGEIRTHLGPRKMLYIYDRDEVLRAEVIGNEESASFELGEGARWRSLARHLLWGMRRGYMYPDRANPHRVVNEISEMSTILDVVRRFLDSDLVVIPPPDLLAIPWPAIVTAAVPGVSTVVAPSAAMWMTANLIGDRHGDIVVAAGPRLSHARKEADVVATIYEDAEPLVGDASTVETVLRAMDSASLLHAVAHGHLRSDNPMFSALELADGNLSLYDLEALKATPRTVVLSACDSAHGNVVGGLELHGLSSVLLSKGTRSVISTVAPIPDSSQSVAAMRHFHQGLANGMTPSAALASTQAEASAESLDPALAFVVFGAD